MTPTSFTHIVVKYEYDGNGRYLRKTSVVYIATSLAEASRVNRRLIQAAARIPGSTALYAIREYELLSLYQKGSL